MTKIIIHDSDCNFTISKKVLRELKYMLYDWGGITLSNKAIIKALKHCPIALGESILYRSGNLDTMPREHFIDTVLDLLKEGIIKGKQDL